MGHATLRMTCPSPLSVAFLIMALMRSHRPCKRVYTFLVSLRLLVLHVVSTDAPHHHRKQPRMGKLQLKRSYTACSSYLQFMSRRLLKDQLGSIPLSQTPTQPLTWYTSPRSGRRCLAIRNRVGHSSLVCGVHTSSRLRKGSDRLWSTADRNRHPC